MKTTVVLGSLVLAIAAAGGLSACGGSSKSNAPPAQHVQLTKSDIPDVMMPGVWTGIEDAYRDGNSVTIDTTWPDTPQRRDDAGSAALAAAGDLGYVYSVTVKGSQGQTLGTWTPR